MTNCTINEAERSLSQENIEEIRTILDTYANGWNKGKPQDTVLSLFIDEAVLLPHHGAPQMEGKENIKNHFWPDSLDSMSIHTILKSGRSLGMEIRRSVRGDMQFPFLLRVMVMRTLNNAGNYTMLFIKVNDERKITRYIWNALIWKYRL